MRKLCSSILVALIVSLLALPALAAPRVQEGPGVHFGAYRLEAGDRVVGDVVVFGGPVLLGRNSELSGDLTVFGPLTTEVGSELRGNLVVLGTADLAGHIGGDVFAAGALDLRETVRIDGDVSAAGPMNQAPGAVVRGDLLPMTRGWLSRWSFVAPGPALGLRWREGPVTIHRTPRWAAFFWNLVRGVANVVLMGLLALVIASVWPISLTRVSQTMETASLTSFGVGLLALMLTALVALVLAITICLSPLALIGLVIVGAGTLFGWIALGMAVGHRVLVGVFNERSPNVALSTVMGVILVTLILAIARLFGPLRTLLMLVLVPPATGAVVLTRFGTQVYTSKPTKSAGPVLARPSVQPAASPSVAESDEADDTTMPTQDNRGSLNEESL